MKKMNSISRYSLIIAFFLTIVTLIGSIQAQNNIKTILTSDNYDLPRSQQASPLGNLSNYNLIINCTLDQTVYEAPVITEQYIPVSDDLAKEIAKEIFNMEIIDEPKVTSSNGGISLTDGKSVLEFYGLNRLHFFVRGLHTTVEDWNRDEVINVAEQFLDTLTNYMNFNSDLTLRIDYVGPIRRSTHVSLSGETTTQIIRTVGVSYISSVQGIDLTGNGADIVIEMADNKILYLEVHLPAVTISGLQPVLVTPVEAVANFINGTSAVKSLGMNPMVYDIPKEGTCIIESVKLVYLVNLAETVQPTPVLLYEIRGKLIYNDPVFGEVQDAFYDYQFVN